MRHVLIKLHTYIGLIVGIFIVLQALTGIALIFLHHLFYWQYPELNFPVEDRSYASIETVMAEAADLSEYSIEEIIAPHGRFRLNHFLAFGFADESAPTAVSEPILIFHPYTGEYVRAIDLQEAYSLLPLVYHSNLLSGEMGERIIAILGLILSTTSLLALYIWWPQRRPALRKALHLEMRGGFQRKVYRVHAVFGFFFVIPIALMGFTGFALHYPEWVKAPTHELKPTTAEDWGFDPTEQEICAPSGFVRAADIALRMRPDARISTISRPREGRPYWFVRTKKSGDLDRLSGDYTVYLSPICLDLLAEERVSDQPWWHRSLFVSFHTGRLFGLAGEGFLVVTGLVLTVLPITGFVIWLRRRHRVTDKGLLSAFIRRLRK